MRHTITALSFLFTTTLFSTECTYQTQFPKVSWKAFKTYEKAGVNGSFDQAHFKSSPAKSIEESLIGTTITLQTKSINSGNAGRDATLVKAFFNVQKSETIMAVIESAKNSKAYVSITMNGVKKLIPMPYTIDENGITAKGSIDLEDFMMLPSLNSINKACYELHEGKTWQDVEIGFKMTLTKVCH
jgi:polyisoprenoid-binding protein YceI